MGSVEFTADSLEIEVTLLILIFIILDFQCCTILLKHNDRRGLRTTILAVFTVNREVHYVIHGLLIIHYTIGRWI